MSKPKIDDIQVRDFDLNIERQEGDDENIVRLSFSSENPVERFWGIEILDHSPESVRLDRISDGGALLVNHDWDFQVGVIRKASMDSDRKGRAVCQFSRNQSSQEILNDVRDEIRTKVSVAYRIHDMELESKDDGISTYRITDWEPYEISLVSVPADASVGVNRNFNTVGKPIMPDDKIPETPPTRTDSETPPTVDPETPPTVDPETPPTGTDPKTPSIVDPETPPTRTDHEAQTIRAIGRHFNLEQRAEDELMLGTSVDAFREIVRQQRPKPVPQPVGRIESNIPVRGQLRVYRPELFDGGRREAYECAYRAGQWIQAVVFNNADAFRWCRDNQVQLALATQQLTYARAMTGIGSGQSVLVPDELALPIINLREEYGIARQRCYIHPMVSDTASIPRRIRGVNAYFVGREDPHTQDEPQFDNVNLMAKNIACETPIHNDYAEDSVINLADFVAQEHALAFATKEDSCLVDGDGTSPYGGIVGLRTALLTTVGGVVAAAGHNTFLTVDSDDLDAVVSLLPDYRGIMPSWYASKRGEALMFGRLRTAAGGNTKTDLAMRAPKQWDGDEIAISPAMPKGTGTTSYADEVMAIYGDLSMGVTFGDRRGMTMLVDPYSLSSYQQIKVIHSERFDINCHGVGNANEAGPIVGLVGAP